MSARVGPKAVIDLVNVSAFLVPTDFPESDGTYEWDSTTLVLVEVRAGGATGLGYSYADTATARLVHDKLADVVRRRDAMDVVGSWWAMLGAVRNLGHRGIAAMAISAVDAALWDLKARLLGLPLVTLLGAVHDAAPVYGSGGFTSYPIDRLQRQLSGWTSSGISRVKMKIGRHPEEDVSRVRAAREAIGGNSDCSWMPTAPTAANRPSRRLNDLPSWE
jgi:L-alanine-DL-glutamate epimerase-like enolase superfamily enzyme